MDQSQTTPTHRNLRWYHDQHGKPSTMRLIALPAGFTATVGLGACVVGLFMGVETTGLAGVMAGVIGLTMGAKWAQSREER